MDKQEFHTNVHALPVIDTHEHWSAERFCTGRPLDFFDLLIPYCVDNLLTAGMSLLEWKTLMQKDLGFEPRWALFTQYLDDVRDTTYFRVLEQTLRKRYGFTGYTAESVLEVGHRLTAENTEGLYDRVMKREGIESALTFVSYENPLAQREARVHPVPTVSDICPRSIPDLERLSRVSGVPISDFDSLLAAVVALFDSYQAQGIRAVKFGGAYRRKLDYRMTTRQDAEEVLVRLRSDPYMGDSRVIGAPHAVLPMQDVRPLDDFLTDRMMELARERSLPVFIHVGIHAWNENSVEATHGSHLEGLVRRHPGTTFILLHCGVPFIDEAVLLCKYFPNVHLNMTWTHIIDTAQARLCVRKFVEMLPANKIHGFGGDYVYPQQINGHLAVAKENIACGLWSLVEEGALDAERAVGIARKWLYENPKRLLSL